ncbi:MAG: hypothetical protein QOJ11_3225, partial [Frankiales bacterium]|nr:hypothetical protein [Frankiales bacterium]
MATRGSVAPRSGGKPSGKQPAGGKSGAPAAERGNAAKRTAQPARKTAARVASPRTKATPRSG